MNTEIYPSKEDNCLKFGEILSNPDPNEEIVISGISGSFPSADNVDIFKTNLFNKVDMISKSRWDIEHPEVPKRSGVVGKVEKFDAGFFGVHERQAHSMDPMTRMLMEKVVECIIDAGLHPLELRKTRTGVFTAACVMETEAKISTNFLQPDSYLFTGVSKSMVAQRISYYLQLTGPSMVIDTACSSSLYALEHAFKAIRLGECDNAIVGGVNLCLHPYASLQFARLGVLSPEGCCRPFDKDGRGYVRSDTICAVFLQKAKDAKRIYAQVVHGKTGCDGYKEHGITYPSGQDQEKLLREFYEECHVNPLSLSFVEAHGTGTVVGDPEECHAIDQVFATGKKESVLIGSVKSSIGHSEAASGLGSVAKCIIAMETGLIPPNINYTAPKESIVAIKEERLEVVTNTRKFRDDRRLLGVNSFGFGGGNCHVLLKSKAKNKIQDGVPQDDLPRLVCVSGRTREGVNVLLDDISCNKIDAEYIKLIHDVFSKDMLNHPYRGFIIASKHGEITRDLDLVCANQDLYLIFSKINNWSLIANHLMNIPVFLESIKRIEEILLPKQMNITKIIREGLRVSHDILGAVILQVCIVDVIKGLNIKPRAAMGYSIGELVCAYYEGAITLEETIRFACIVEEEFHSNDKKMENGVDKIDKVNEHTEEVIFENGIKDTYSEPSEALRKTIRKVFRASGALKYNRTAVRHFVDMLRKPTSISFKPLRKSIVWEIGNSQVQDLYNDYNDHYLLSFSTFSNKNHFLKLTQILGRLYLLGYNSDLSKLYPKVDLPVSCGTRMISPKIRWNHARDWFVLKFRLPEIRNRMTFKIDLSDSNWSFIAGHVIDGRNLFPAAGYLYLVWDVFSNMKNIDLEYMAAVFENCRFIRATTVPQSGVLELTVMILTNSGHFEVTEGESLVVTGRVSLVENIDDEFTSLPDRSSKESLPLYPKDVYKELRLRGYNYTGLFRAIKEYHTSTSTGLVRWDDNWICFIDNLFQTKILQTDTRLLYVPTNIARLTIVSRVHRACIDKHRNNEGPTDLPVYYYPEADIIRSGGVKVTGLIASSINRKKYLGTPVLEKYEFVPNNASLPIHQSVRVNMQIILENILTYTLNIAEVVESQPESDLLLSPLINSCLEDQPLISANINILSEIPLETDFPVEQKSLNTNDDYTVVVVSDVFNRPQMLNQVLQAITSNGYVISREAVDFNVSNVTRSDVVIQTVHHTPTETLVLLTRSLQSKKRANIQLKESDLSWIADVQNALAQDQEIVLFTEDEPLGGIVGFVNCLRREPGGNYTRCVFLMDQEKRYNATDLLYVAQLSKQMAINIYKNGEWGTYRHLLLEDVAPRKAQHAYVNITVKGDLSSLRWMEGPLGLDFRNTDPEKQLVQVYYAALNFRDIMTATGKINADVITTDRIDQECVQGFEFTGVTKGGTRVMGMVNNGALATLVLADSHLLWKVPDSWSLAEASTVPVVYSTVIYALFLRGKMKSGETVLIHSGTGGIGQAAIRLALHHGCTVFTTVGTDSKKEFLKKMYPQLNDRYIGNSHDLSFEQLVMKETNGRGVDLVLNSLAEEMLLASVRCLAMGGRFLEIGKFDISSNNPVNLALLEKDGSFHGVMLDKLFSSDPNEKHIITEYLNKYIADGAIKPLGRSVFKCNEIEQAFRFMAGGKHKGKVLIQIRDEMTIGSPQIEEFTSLPRYYCSPEKSYIIIGGLGGFGLELADWLVLRGAKNLILTSRSGIKTGYQQMRIRVWKSYGTVVKVSTADVVKREGCLQLIEEASQLGPIDGIFNLAAVLQDAVFENQTVDMFRTSLAPKASVTRHLDAITRRMCPNIRDFVVFSSVSCGRGNAGQTNYGMANSIMERICEKRREDGYAALAIEWGAIGEVGLVAEMQEDHAELEISGTLQQRISSCLQVLDTFLRQEHATIVSSMVVAEKKTGTGSDSIVACVANILGISDVKMVSPLSTLAELGMDSMTAVEIKQILEREHGTFFAAKDIRSLTFARLKELEEEKQFNSTDLDKPKDTDEPLDLIAFDLIPNEINLLQPQVRMRTKISENEHAPTVILIPGIEGFSKIFETLSNQLDSVHAVTIQYDYNNPASTIADTAKAHLPHAKDILKDDKTFVIAAHSYGVLIALELVILLENEGLTGTLFCIDGSPALLMDFFKIMSSASEEVFQTNFICNMLSFYTPKNILSEHTDAIAKCKSLEERIDVAAEIGARSLPFSKEDQRKICLGLYRRMKSLSNYKPSYSNIKSRVKLCKPTKLSVDRIAEDYNLSEVCKKPIEVEVYEGNHITIVRNETLAKEINSCASGSE